jgi:18S rRNA (guanine1575-N7)-methyltransferase
MITSAAQKAGFGGGLVVDYPNSRKARKMYLVLMVGAQGGDNVPKALDGSPAEVMARGKLRDEVLNEKKRRKDKSGRGGKKGKKELVGKEWIMKKKELYRTRGKEGYVYFFADLFTGVVILKWILDAICECILTDSVPRDSKYTARKRRVKF